MKQEYFHQEKAHSIRNKLKNEKQKDTQKYKGDLTKIKYGLQPWNS